MEGHPVRKLHIRQMLMASPIKVTPVHSRISDSLYQRVIVKILPSRQRQEPIVNQISLKIATELKC
jgi:hypothetical protein